MPSLHEIQKTVTTLWLNKEAREWFLSDRSAPRPECLKDAPEVILQSADASGINLYGHLLSFGSVDVMDAIYPLCKKVIGKQWDSVVEQYMLKCPPDHPNFNRVCSKFPQFVTKYGGTLLENKPFLAELADYEWIELETLEHTADDVSLPHEELVSPQQIVGQIPVVNPTLTVREYNYNICTLVAKLEDGKRVQKVKPQRTLVAIYRHPETKRCKFVEIGEAAAKIIDEARTGIAYQALLQLAIKLTPELEPQESAAQFLELVEQLQELRIFAGSRSV